MTESLDLGMNGIEEHELRPSVYSHICRAGWVSRRETKEGERSLRRQMAGVVGAVYRSRTWTSQGEDVGWPRDSGRRLCSP